MACKECIHDGVCHIQEMSTGLELEEYIREFGCEDFKNKADFVEVKHGEWLMCLSDDPWRKGYHGRCSECGAFYTYNINKMPRRCDNCDAKMDGRDINVSTK